MEIEEIENIEKKDVNNVTFFFYFLNNTENNDLYFFTKDKYNLKNSNVISKEELFHQISLGKKKCIEKKSKLVSILVHNNYADPLEFNKSNDSFVHETNGLTDITFNKTYKEFLKLNSIHIVFKVNDVNNNNSTKKNLNYNRRTRKNI